MKYSIIIPVYNEISFLPDLLDGLYSYSKSNNEIIIIDDGSNDGSIAILNECNFIKLIAFNENRGKGNAIKLGLLEAKNDLIIIFDGDLEIAPSELGKLMILDKNNGINSAMGYRFKHLNPIKSGVDWGNFIFTTFFNILLNTNHKDVLCCAKAFYKHDFDIRTLQSKNFSIDIELAFILSLSNKNIKQVKMDYSRRGKSEGKKLEISNGWDILLRIIKMVRYL